MLHHGLVQGILTEGGLFLGNLMRDSVLVRDGLKPNALSEERKTFWILEVVLEGAC